MGWVADLIPYYTCVMKLVMKKRVLIFQTDINFKYLKEEFNINYRENNVLEALKSIRKISEKTKGWDISAVSFHKLLQILYKSKAMNEWGSIVALTYIAAQRTFPNYNDMAENKAYLESIARSFGYFFGKDYKVRINTISQSPTLTKAGEGVKGLEGFLKYSEKMSPLGNASAEDCAKYTVMMFSDYTKKVSLQNLYHDGGFSNVGVSQEIIDSI